MTGYTTEDWSDLFVAAAGAGAVLTAQSVHAPRPWSGSLLR